MVNLSRTVRCTYLQPTTNHYVERSPAERIPVEIVSNILQHLSISDGKNARLVNSRWYEASRRLMFQKRQRFVFDGLLHKNQLGLVLEEIESFGYQYYDLEFHNEDFNLSLNEFLTFIKSNLLYIGRLSFQKCSFPFVIVEEILINCINLRELVFKNCSFDGFEEAILIPSFKKEIIRKNLISLEIIKCKWITGHIIKVFYDIYPNVQRIRIWADDNVRYVANFHRSIQRPKTNLSFLMNSVMHRETYGDRFFDNIVMSYLWIQFEEFTLTDPYNDYGENDFEAFLLTQQHLKSINLKWCENFHLDSLELLFHHIPNLKRLNFSLRWARGEVSTKRIIELISNSKLEVLQLELYSCYQPNPHFQKLCRNNHTYYLNISNSWTRSEVISDTLLMSLLKTFYNLTYLDVSRIQIQGSSREVITLIFRQQDQLRYLKANDCAWINDFAFKRCCLPKLEYLELKNTRIKHAAFSKFDFPKLKVLRLETCHRIPDESFTLLPSKCPLLRYLNVKGTTIGKKTILNICKNLKFLHCMNILKRNSPPILDLDLISQVCPSLRFIQMGRFNPASYESYYERELANVYVFSSFEKKWCKFDALRLPCIRCEPSKRRLKDLNF